MQLKKELLEQKAHDFLENATCTFKGEIIFGYTYTQELPTQVLLSIGILKQECSDSLVANLVLSYLTQSLSNETSIDTVCIEILTEALGKEFIPYSTPQRNIIDLALEYLQT